MNSSLKTKIGYTNLWISLLKGIILIIFGIWLLKSPIESLTKLSLFFGLLIIAGGLLEVYMAFNNRQTGKSWEWTLTSGVIDVLLGTFIVANPGFILILITALVSIWFLIRGIILVRNSFMIKSKNNPNYIYSLIFGIMLILLAVIFTWHPEVLGFTIAFWTALAFICLGIFRIILVFRYF